LNEKDSDYSQKMTKFIRVSSMIADNQICQQILVMFIWDVILRTQNVTHITMQ